MLSCQVQVTMKYALLLPDGAADEPVAELGGLTPLQAARTPHLDGVAEQGLSGLAVTAPSGFTPGSDVCTLSVVGYDPAQYYTGRAPLEAAAQSLPIGENDTVVRCNFVTVHDGKMADFSAGHIEQHDAEQLIEALNTELATDEQQFHCGIMYRHLLVLRDTADLQARCKPPHDIPDGVVADHRPVGRDAERLESLMERAARVLDAHPVNGARRDAGQQPATDIWLWGHGCMPVLDSFETRFGLRGVAITAVDLIRGIARLIGWPVLDVPGATGYLDTDYAAKGRYAVDAIDDYDLVAVHVEAPDEAGHNGDVAAKVIAIERFDADVVGPVVERLQRGSQPWRVLIMPDHPTPVDKRLHTAEPPPFVLAGEGIVADETQTFDEVAAASTGRVIDPGHHLMAQFLGT
jgi:2,3-bisphosphoglycerate-independent phosphoglycerate mutase